MDNRQWTMKNGDNGDTKTTSPVSFQAEKKEYTPTGLYFKPGNHKCELHLNDCQINPIINGNVTLIISTTGHGPICITGNRKEMNAKLWELLARVDPLHIQKIDQAITNLQAIANLANTDDAGPDLEAMASHTADLLAEVLAGVLNDA